MQERAADGSVLANLLTGGIDEVFQQTDATGPRSFLTDALGSTLALTDDAGAIQTEYSYESFGKTQQTGQSNSNPFQFTGRENDSQTGLYFYRARYYSPQLQRFISEDPLGVMGGDNAYSYVGNNLINFNDPLGLAPQTGPVNYARDIFDTGYKPLDAILNDPGNEISDMLGLDMVAEWAWAIGNPCLRV